MLCRNKEKPTNEDLWTFGPWTFADVCKYTLVQGRFVMKPPNMCKIGGGGEVQTHLIDHGEWQVKFKASDLICFKT